MFETQSYFTVALINRLQRLAMLDTSSFHEQLLLLCCGQDDDELVGEGGVAASRQYRQQLALDVLTWVLAVKMNNTSHK